MRKLASVLNVNYVWLALGTSHGEIERRRTFAARQDSAVYALAGYLLEQGFNVAFSLGDTFHDIDAVGHGIHLAIAVTAASKAGRYAWNSSASIGADSLVNVVAFRREEASFSYDFFDVGSKRLSSPTQTSARDTKIEIRFDQSPGRYTVNGRVVNEFLKEGIRRE